MFQEIKVNSLEVNQPIGKFYVGVMDYTDLEYISHTDVRRLKSEKRDVEEYIGIQRPLSSSREKEIGKYVNLVDATFPNSILITIPSENAHFDNETNTLTIDRKPDVAKVLDGQHRIAGLNHYTKDGENFQLIVTIFIDMELEDQAIVFSTINKTHTKVNKSLTYDLFEFATSRSPQRTAHNVARALNQKDGSPFENKIKILGVADDKEKETITQATFVEALLKFITKDKMTDRDLYRRGKSPEKYTEKENKKYFFRPLFLDKDDAKIAQAMWDFFKAVERKWPIAWREVTPNRILNRSTGFLALMRFMSTVYQEKGIVGDVISSKEFDAILESIDLEDDSFTKENYIPGSSGQSQLYKDLLEKSSF